MITPDDLDDAKEVRAEVNQIVKAITAIDILPYRTESLLIAFSEALVMLGIAHDIRLAEMKEILEMTYKKMLAFK